MQDVRVRPEKRFPCSVAQDDNRRGASLLLVRGKRGESRGAWFPSIENLSDRDDLPSSAQWNLTFRFVSDNPQSAAIQPSC
jgi:hypothetical protein